MTSPTSVPLHLLALEQAAQPGTLGDLAVGGDSATRVTSDSQLRSAIVNVAGYYLRLAKTRTPAQMEALIWDKVSSDGADHGPSCAAFASLTLELAAQAVGQQSWVSGGDTYPWPMAEWADVRVDTNPDSPGITSLVADAQANERWHPLGDGYQPRPGDWAVYDQHVEVVTSYSHGVLDTIGADSLPDLTVNAHSSAAPLAEQGVAGFVDNGNLKPAGAAGSQEAVPGQGASGAATGAPGTSQGGGGKAGTGKGAPETGGAGKAATGKAGPGSASTGQADSGKADSGKTDSGNSGSGKAAPSAPDPAVAEIPGVPATGAVTQFGASHGAEHTPTSGGTQAAAGTGGTHTGADAGATHGGAGTGGTHAGVAVRAAVPGVLAAGDLLGQVGPSHAVGSGHANAPASTSAAATIPGLSHSAAASAPTDSASTDRTPTDSAPTGNEPTAGSGAVAIPGAAPAHAAATPAAPTKPATTHPAQPTTTPSAQPTHTSAPSAASASPSTAHASSSGRQYATPGTRDQQAFISMVAPGAMAAQQRFGVPAAVTIAQAIEESAWGRSGLAANYHNLFGIKGSGPAGSVSLPTSEFQGGKWVTIDAPFRVYHNDAESIADHAELLATSGYYTRAMADRSVPDAFANDLTGVYATDPDYGANLIALMKLYNLYQFNSSGAPANAATPPTAPTPTASPSVATSSQQADQQDSHPAVPGHQAQASHPAAAPTATGQSGHGQSGHGQSGHQRTGHAVVPGIAAPALAPSAPAVTSATSGLPGAAPAAAGHIPGLVSPGPLAPLATSAGHGRAIPTRATPARTTPARTAPARATQPRAMQPRGTTAGRAAPRPNTGSATIPGVAAPHGASTVGNTVGNAVGHTGGNTAGTATATAPRRAAAQVPGIATANGIVTTARVTRGAAARGPARYQAQLPHAVTTALFASAKAPLGRGEHLYRDVAACTGIDWELLAAVDWMQCKADPRYSPVHGEKIGSLNDDGTSYPTKSAALIQCGCDLIELAAAVYGIDLTARRRLSVRELASAFAAFRWGAILRRHGVSAMEFPYSVAGLTPQHQKMHWPSIDAPDAPDRPGARFREPFGAVPVVLSLDYPATV
jgi:flagellum-specific peptidoglycan hydrolase FlgJ